MVFLGFIVPTLLADKEISLKKVPKKVQLAVKQFIKEKAKGGKVEEVTVEKGDGKKIYEVEIEAPGGGGNMKWKSPPMVKSSRSKRKKTTTPRMTATK